MRRSALCLLLAATVSFTACGGGGGDSSTSAAQIAGCSEVAQPEPKQVKLKRPPLKPPPEGTRAVFATNCGSFTVELDTLRSPRTSASFAYLVEEGVYDGTPFHRVAAAPPIVQGGDPEGTGLGGPGYFVDEPPSPNLSYTKGIVAMAKTEVDPPGRSGSQFFVVTGEDAGLPPDYALAGKVVDGMDTVYAIEALGPPGADGPPSQPVVVEEATLEGA